MPATWTFSSTVLALRALRTVASKTSGLFENCGFFQPGFTFNTHKGKFEDIFFVLVLEATHSKCLKNGQAR